MEISSIPSARASLQPSYAPEPVVRTNTHQARTVPPEIAMQSVQIQPKPDTATLEQAVASTNKVLASKTSNELQFAIDKETSLTVVKLMNRQSGETILQFPSEAMLQIAKSIDQATGALVQRKA
ncbi:flagellar protein FlaG [Rhodoferax sp.]|uniref:flagellar protein FlaG n=1 Tax=Rhodoferax sp. TaxID=50421 RepID=UPI00261B1B94|nr:flagellar protein FlaG [Rhodoferax sp.]MDD2808717.1 flagellar protein FlaG [Rhodoferax sp.]